MKLAIIDFNGTLYDPYSATLMPGALRLLEALKERGIAIVLVSRQALSSAGDELARLGIAEYFAEVAFVAEKTGEYFRTLMDRHGARPEETAVLGDHPFSEIAAGKEAGAFTILLRDWRFPGIGACDTEADATIDHLAEALEFIH